MSELEPSITLIESVFSHLSYTDQIVTLKMLHARMNVCPRCLRDYKFKEEKEARICKSCVLSLIEDFK